MCALYILLKMHITVISLMQNSQINVFDFFRPKKMSCAIISICADDNFSRYFRYFNNELLRSMQSISLDDKRQRGRL